MATLYTYRAGDKVKHRAAFLKSTSWYTDVPRYGVVVDARTWEGMGGRQMLEVEWVGCEAPRKILSSNVLPLDKGDVYA